FGMAPAALLGVDVDAVWGHAAELLVAAGPGVPAAANPGVQLAAFMAGLARGGRDKLTLLAPEPLGPLGDWVEQLVAESTGKQGVGVVPVVGEPVGRPGSYGDDRAFVAYRFGDTEPEGARALADAGHPVLFLDVASREHLGAEFLRWELATALAGALLGVNPFDEPNVTEAKEQTRAILAEVAGGGGVPAPEHGDVPALCATLRPGDYLAIQAYLPPSSATLASFAQARAAARDLRGIATTFGWGPRFLHSTGQLHKGGADNVVVLQIVDATLWQDAAPVDIPGRPYDFGTLIRAQAAGDLGHAAPVRAQGAAWPRSPWTAPTRSSAWPRPWRTASRIPERTRMPAIRRTLTVFAVAGLAWLAIVLTRGALDPPAATLPVRPDSSPASSSPAPAIRRPPLLAGEWQELEPAPIGVPGEHLGAWTGRELVVGDFATGMAAYDPRARRWRVLRGAPRLQRVGAKLAAGEDGRVFLYGGFAPSYNPRPYTADAWMMDRAGRWRALPPPPAPPRWVPAVVWTGSELFVWGGERPGDWMARDAATGWVGGSAYDVAAGRWRPLPPAPIADVWYARGVWAGDRVLVWGQTAAHESFAAAYLPATDEWRPLPPPPLRDPTDAAAVWTGTELVLWGRPRTEAPAESAAPDGVALAPAAGAQWRPLPLVGLGGVPARDSYGYAAAWTPHGMVLHGGYPRAVSLRYDPAAGSWARLPHGGPGPRVTPVLAWTGAEVLVWGGFGTSGPDGRLWAWRPPRASPE
ncbi:MAG TPA: hypothetical protein VNU01_11410, partial [Egibacteraceae bacterium]|nr:hypothetical protein [Egibacteraceae bacterium]